MKSLLTAAAILTTLNMYGQGQGVINFSNVGSPLEDRISVDQGCVTVLASGTGYKIALYWGPRGTPMAGLTQIGPNASFSPLGQGQFAGGNRTITYAGGVNGDIVTVQARGWGTIPGVADTYEAVLAAGLAGDQRAQVGFGPVFDHDTSRLADPTDPATPIGNDPNWRGFTIGYCPEPSTATLAVLGGAAMLLFVRRKTRNPK